MNNKLNEEIIEYIAEFLDVEVADIKPESSLKDDLDADSLDFVELISELEEKYDFEADEDKLVELKTVNDLLEYINSEVK